MQFLQIACHATLRFLDFSVAAKIGISVFFVALCGCGSKYSTNGRSMITSS
jgi:hypothetical protein